MSGAIEHLWGLEPGEETAALCWYKRQSAGVSPWDGSHPRESYEEVFARHEEARLRCHRCPLLAACERALSDMEKQSLRVDGVMAGRYSDVIAYSNGERRFVQTTCRGCRAPLRPQGDVSNNRKFPAGARDHRGEGLCDQCYPRLARAVRNPPPPPPKRSYQENNPIGTPRP